MTGTRPEQDLAKEYKVSAMPTLMGFVKGKVVGQVVGARMPELKALIEKCASARTGMPPCTLPPSRHTPLSVTAGILALFIAGVHLLGSALRQERNVVLGAMT